MPIEFDGPNSKVSANVIEAQSGSTITIQSGHNLSGGGSGLTALNGSNIASGTVAAARLPALGKVVQVANVDNKTFASSTATIPYDQSIPQNTEGTEVMTLAITPTSATNILLIDVNVFYTSSAGSMIVCCSLFQDSTASAIAVGGASMGSASQMRSIKYRHKMTSGTTSATTFKVRMGGNNAGTFSFNGDGQTKWDTNGASGRISSSITIWEIAV